MPPNTSQVPTSVVLEPRTRVSIEIERMTRGPAKVTVRIDGDDSEAVRDEALKTYMDLVAGVSEIEEASEKS